MIVIRLDSTLITYCVLITYLCTATTLYIAWQICTKRCTCKDLPPRNLIQGTLSSSHTSTLRAALLTVSSVTSLAARKPECGTARGTHIKAVDKRKGALIVRRSSIHEVGGYGYTYVLRCMYTTCAHGRARRPVRVHTRGVPLACMEPPRVVTTESLNTAVHGHGTYVGGIVRGPTEKKREREREGKSSPDLPQARDRNSR